MNYEGDDSFKSCGGALISIFTYVIVLIFAGIQAIALVTLNNTAIQQTVEFENYARDQNVLNMEDQELDAVVKVQVTKNGVTRGWEDFDESFGRVVAY